MRAMSAHIQGGEDTSSLAPLLLAEISAHETEVVKYIHDWSEGDIDRIKPILAKEKVEICAAESLSEKIDSVKGEAAMKRVYTWVKQTKATDVITLMDTGNLSLIELKYLVKFASKGPFGGWGSFKKRVVEKFEEMSLVMVPDGEALESLRIIVHLIRFGKKSYFSKHFAYL